MGLNIPHLPRHCRALCVHITCQDQGITPREAIKNNPEMTPHLSPLSLIVLHRLRTSGDALVGVNNVHGRFSKVNPDVQQPSH